MSEHILLWLRMSGWALVSLGVLIICRIADFLPVEALPGFSEHSYLRVVPGRSADGVGAAIVIVGGILVAAAIILSRSLRRRSGV
jgi:hypothetical protein